MMSSGSPKTGEFAHLHRREQPEAPKQDRSSRSTKPATRERGKRWAKPRDELGFDQPRHADEQKEKAGDQASGLERQMINHA